jgi:histidine triad (HIT) family protein
MLPREGSSSRMRWSMRDTPSPEPDRPRTGATSLPSRCALTDPEAAALGLLVNRMARALKEVAEAEHVYSFVFGDGVAHLHVVLAPRYAGTPRQYWGVRLAEWPGAPRVGEPEMRTLVARLRDHVVDE